MQKSAIYGIIAAAVVAAGIGITFGAMSMNSAEPAVASPQSPDNNEVRVIKHDMGETEITGTPNRVVVLTPEYFGEAFLILGVEPAGAADIAKATNLWYPEMSQWTNTVDVGTRNEPNLEAITQVEPDLIISISRFHSEIYDELSDIAPTIVLSRTPNESISDESKGLTGLELYECNFMAIADALNRHDDGVAALQEMHAHFDEARSELEAADATGEKFIFVQFGIESEALVVDIHVDTLLPSVLENELGMVNVLQDYDEAQLTAVGSYMPFGGYITGLEGLASLDSPDVHIFYPDVGTTARAFELLEDNPVWSNLEFVKRGNIHSIGQGIHTIGAGPIRLVDFADRAVEALNSGGNGVRVIKHDMGETEITGTPERVVLMDTHSFSIMMDLGIEPVGVHSWEEDTLAGGKIFWEAYYPGITQKWPNVVNTGYYPPSLEVIAQLEPDLIIAPSWGAEVYDDLSEMAPTILYTDAPPEGGDLDQLETAERITMGIADALNRHDDGVAMIEEFHYHLEENAAKLEEADVKGKKFIFAQTWTEDDSSVFIRVWAGPSKPSLILEEMGIVNAAPMPDGVLEDGRWDGIGLEGLSTLDGPDVHFMYMPSGDDDAIADQWIDKNPVWNDLSFVKEGRVYKLDPYLYMYGGPQKDAEFADAVVKLLTAES